MSDDPLFKTSLKKAMDLCARHEFCCSEIRDKLRSWGVGSIDNEKIIDLLLSENYINEARFSKAFVKDKFNFNKWGKIKIAAHLSAKNIPGDIINTSLDTIDNDQYNKRLIDLINCHRRSVKAKNQYDLKAKLLRYGLSKGYESSRLYDILNDLEPPLGGRG